MTTQPVSVILPISQAFERVKQVLFRPFDLGRWFVIGFCAWLAGLGEQGFNGGSSTEWRRPGGDIHREVEHARNFVVDNLYWIVPVAAILVLAALALWVLFTWLNSRGKFMFLHCVALNKAEVVAPWNQFAQQANSLFWFRLVLALIGMAVMLPFLALTVFVAFGMAAQHGWILPGILSFIGLVLAMVGIGIFFFIIEKFTADFVVPIMFLRGKRCLEAWSELRGLLAANLGQFVLYLLFQILLWLVIGIMVLIIVFATCCVAGCLLAIPYLGTVLFLPVLVFKRAYSLHYFAQFGREYDVFAPGAPA